MAGKRPPASNGCESRFLFTQFQGQAVRVMEKGHPLPAEWVPADLLARDAQGFQALLSFIRRAFLSNFKTVRFALPAWAAVAPLLPECAHMKRESFFNGMVRAVNVEKLLGLCACKGEGVLTLEAADPLLEENNAVFRLSFREGTENQVERVQEKPDIRLGTGELGALLCGVHSVEALRWMPQVKVENPAAPLAQVFYPKPCHVTELF